MTATITLEISTSVSLLSTFFKGIHQQKQTSFMNLHEDILHKHGFTIYITHTHTLAHSHYIVAVHDNDDGDNSLTISNCSTDQRKHG